MRSQVIIVSCLVLCLVICVNEGIAVPARDDVRAVYGEREDIKTLWSSLRTRPDEYRDGIRAALIKGGRGADRSAVWDPATLDASVEKHFLAMGAFFRFLYEAEVPTPSDVGVMVELLDDPSAFMPSRINAGYTLYLSSGNIEYFLKCLELHPGGTELFLEVRDPAFEEILSRLIAGVVLDDGSGGDRRGHRYARVFGGNMAAGKMVKSIWFQQVSPHVRRVVMRQIIICEQGLSLNLRATLNEIYEAVGAMPPEAMTEFLEAVVDVGSAQKVRALLSLDPDLAVKLTEIVGRRREEFSQSMTKLELQVQSALRTIELRKDADRKRDAKKE